MQVSPTYLLSLCSILLTSGLLTLIFKKKLVEHSSDTIDLLICIIGIQLITRPLALWGSIYTLSYLYHDLNTSLILPISFAPLIYWLLILITFLVDTILIIWTMRFSLNQSVKISFVLQIATLISAFLFSLLR